MCRRTGALVAYFGPAEVRVEGETVAYFTGDRFIRFQTRSRSPCSHVPRTCCACRSHWSANPEALAGELPEDIRAALTTRMGVNARLLDGFEMREGPHGPAPFLSGAELEVRFFDNTGS